MESAGAGRSARERAPVPRPFLWLVLGVSLVAVIALLSGAWRAGQTWDEGAMSAYTQGYFATGWFTDASAVVNGVVNPGYAWLYSYGPIANLIAHGGAALIGVEPWGSLRFDSIGVAARHVATAIVSLGGIAAVVGIARSLTGSWKWAVVAGGMLLATPLWLGHAMFNIKDTPVAVGYSMATFGAVLLVSDGYRSRRGMRWGALLSILAGAVVAAGTRPASGAALAIGVLAAPVAWWAWRRLGEVGDARQDLVDAMKRLAWALLALITAYVALVLVYPRAFGNPVKLGYEALVVSAGFPFDEPVLTAGIWMQQPPPASYLPLWFGAQLPLIILAFVGVGVAAWVVRLAGVRRHAGARALRFTAVPALVPVLLQAFLLPLAAVLLQSPIYNGSRQFLFAVPAFVVLAAVGLRVAVVAIARRPRARGLVPLLWVVVGVGLVVPVVSSLRLVPYTYTYMNAVASLRPIDGFWPTDYWRASSNELMRRLPAQGPESCAYEEGRTGRFNPCADQPMFTAYLAERGSESVGAVLEPGERWLVRENQGVTEIPDGCRLIDTISRPNLWRTITIGQILACRSGIQAVA